LRARLPLLIALHVLISAVGEALFALRFGHNPRVIATHVVLIIEWDLALFLLVRAIAALVPPPRGIGHTGSAEAWPGVAFRLVLAVTCTLQIYLYLLNVVSNTSWGRNITGHLVVAFAPTVWSGKEPFPLGALGISIVGIGTLLAITSLLGSAGRCPAHDAVRFNESGSWRPQSGWRGCLASRSDGVSTPATTCSGSTS
jgi:hypothetical protein